MEERRCERCFVPTVRAVCEHCGWPVQGRNEPHQLPVGTVLGGRYQVGKVLGQGGFGITYLGWDRQERREVAVKEFFPNRLVNRDRVTGLSLRLSASDGAAAYRAGVDRFLREARILSGMEQNDRIVKIYDSFSENETSYIVMEFVRGVTLAQYIQSRGGELPADEALRLLEPIFGALESVHTHDLVHRDVSPDNIMMDPRIGAKLLDFGAAREVTAADPEKALTRSTEAILKEGFAPPEQYFGRGSLGPWTDGYALCATLYYCITGTVPPDAMNRSNGETIDWGTVTGLTDAQRQALEKGMALRAADRFPDVKSLQAALYGPASSQKEEKRKKKRKKALPAVLVAVAVLAVAVGGAMFLLRGNITGAQRQSPSAGTVETEGSDASETTAPLPETTMPPEPWEENVLKADPLYHMGAPRVEILEARFLSDLDGAPEDAVDLSQTGDGSVLGWFEDGTVTFAAEGGINGRDACRSLFSGCSSLVSVSFGDSFHTEQATSMAEMFAGCRSLVSVDVQNLDLRNTTNITGMFRMGTEIEYYEVENEHWLEFIMSGEEEEEEWLFSSLEQLDVSGWDTSSVTDMGQAFQYCDALTELDVSGWDTSSVTDMSSLFFSCGSMTELDVSGWGTSAVTDMSCLFYTCGSLTELDVSGWDTSSVTDMSNLFSACSSLTELRVSGWDTSSVTNIRDMFYYCTALTELDVSGWDTSGVTDMGRTFNCCGSLTRLEVGNWDTSRVVNMEGMFAHCGSLTELDVSRWDVSSVEDMGGAHFGGMEYISGMFGGCTALKTLDVSDWDTSSVVSMYGMFSGCRALTALDVSGWDTSSVVHMRKMFDNCDALVTLDVSGWDTSNVVSFSGMFYCCDSLVDMDVSDWNTSNVTDVSYMFYGSPNVKVTGVTKWDISNVEESLYFAEFGVLFDGRGWPSIFK